MFGWLIMFCCIVFFYRVGEQEYDGSPIPALISLGLWLLGSFALGFGMIVNLVLQVALFLGLTAWNIRRGPR